MPQLYANIVGALWLVWLAFWVISAARVKPIARVETAQSRLTATIPLFVAGWLMLGGRLSTLLDGRFLPDSVAVAWVGVVLTAAGLAFAIWARIALGGNWSGTVTVKQNHELVERGPYMVVRHPIYTGLILATLGTAIAIGQWRALLAVALVIAALWFKLRVEERMMRETFGATYDEYAHRVRALIPFVL